MSSYAKLTKNNNGNLPHVENNGQGTNNTTKSALSLFRMSNGSPDLKEPLKLPDMEAGVHDDDPFYVFREDLYRKLDLVDEGLQDFLRVVHQTVRLISRCASLGIRRQGLIYSVDSPAFHRIPLLTCMS